MSDRPTAGGLHDDGLPDMSEIDWGPRQESLEDGDPCPECDHPFGDDWDCREVAPGAPTAGQTWNYTCPGCGQETCSIGT